MAYGKDTSMMLKVLGAIFVIIGSGYTGFLLCILHKRKVKTIKELIAALEYMECELRFHNSALPELCRQAASICSDKLGYFFVAFADSLEECVFLDACQCMEGELRECNDLPACVKEYMIKFGQTVGSFDVDGQIKCIRRVCDDCCCSLEKIQAEDSNRLKNYKTVSICTGLAIAILLF